MKSINTTMTNEQNNIDRREAIQKLGKYAAFTALGTIIMLTPQKAQACSSPPCGNGHGHGVGNGNGHGHGGWRPQRNRKSIFKRK